MSQAPQHRSGGAAMKIAVASSGLGHVARGIESWASDLGAALFDRNEDVTLFKGGGAADRPYERFIPCLQRGDVRTARLRRWLPRRVSWRLGLGSGYDVEQTTFAWNLIPRIVKHQYDILHVQDPIVALAVQRARRLGLVRTRTILGDGTEESPEFLSRIDLVQHTAPWHLEQSKALGVAKPTWTAISNFIDAETFRPDGPALLREELGINAESPIILTAAAIKRQHKRIDYLLEEFSNIVNDESRPVLVVAGGWEADTDDLVARGTALLSDSVRFLVRFPRRRMPELYRMADIFALCSLKEVSPIAVIEACASGLPCLVHRHPVLQWMTGPGGVTIDMATAGSLAGAMRALITDPGRRATLGALAREHCLATFSRDRVVDQIIDYYRRVLGKYHDPSAASRAAADGIS